MATVQNKLSEVAMNRTITEWIEMSKDEFVAEMVTIGVKYKPGLFPNGAWKQEGSILIAYAEGILVGQYDEVTGRGWSQQNGESP
jgi:hypothetical protein